MRCFGVDLAVILPTDAAHDLEDVGRGRIVAPMPAGQALVTVYGESLAGRQELDALALTAYDMRSYENDGFRWPTASARSGAGR